MIQYILLSEIAILFGIVFIWVLLLFNNYTYKISKRLIGGCGLGLFIAGLIPLPMNWRLIFSGFYFLIIDAVLEILREN